MLHGARGTIRTAASTLLSKKAAQSLQPRQKACSAYLAVEDSKSEDTGPISKEHEDDQSSCLSNSACTDFDYTDGFTDCDDTGDSNSDYHDLGNEQSAVLEPDEDFDHTGEACELCV